MQASTGVQRLIARAPNRQILEVGEDRIHVTRDRPSSRTDEADRLLRRIAGSGGVSAIIVPGAAGEPAKRVAATGNRL